MKKLSRTIAQLAITGNRHVVAADAMEDERFGQQLSVKFTSATTYGVYSSGGALITSGSFSGSNGAEVAIGYPSPPAPASPPA